MDKQNWLIIIQDLIDAKEDLGKLETQVHSANYPDDIEFKITMQHIYHHLNFAWNARNILPDEYAHQSQMDFETLGKFPTDLYFD